MRLYQLFTRHARPDMGEGSRDNPARRNGTNRVPGSSEAVKMQPVCHASSALLSLENGTGPSQECQERHRNAGIAGRTRPWRREERAPQHDKPMSTDRALGEPRCISSPSPETKLKPSTEAQAQNIVLDCDLHKDRGLGGGVGTRSEVALPAVSRGLGGDAVGVDLKTKNRRKNVNSARYRPI